MEITFVVDYYPFLAGKVVFQLVKHLKRFGVEARIISSSILAENQTREPDMLRLKAWRISFSGAPYILYNLYDLHKLPSFSKEAGIISLHFTEHPLPLYYGLFKKLHLIRSPIVATPHGSPPAGHPSTFVRCMSSILYYISEALVLDGASAITTVSRKEYEFFRNKYPTKIVEHIPNGVDTSFFKPDKSKREMFRQKFQVADDEVLVLYFAGLRTQKGVLILLDAIRNVMKKNMKIAFLIAGPGPLASHIKTFVDDQRNRRIHTITEYIPHEYTPYLYNACDIYVLPSFHEGMPLSLMEAMACGKPVIATPVGDVPLLVEKGINGFLVPTNDVNALSDTIAYLAKRPEISEKMGKKNVAKMRQYDWDETSEKYLRLFRKVLTAHASSLEVSA